MTSPSILTQSQEPICQLLQAGIGDGLVRAVEGLDLDVHTVAHVTPVALAIVLAGAIAENRTRNLGGPDLEAVISLLRRLMEFAP